MTFHYAHAAKTTGTGLPVRYLLLALLLIAETSYGAWDAIPELRLQTEVDDNPRLEREAQVGTVNDASRITLDARLALLNYGERGSIYIQPRIRTSAYSDADDEDLEDDEIFLRSYAYYQWPAVEIGYYVGAERQNIRNAEFRPSAPVDPDNPDPIDPGTGLGNIVDGEREALWATQHIEFQISDRNNIRVDLTQQDVFYSGPAVRGRSDFRQNEISVSLLRGVGEITRVTARVFASEFEADKNNNITDTVGVEGSFTQPLGATWTMNVSAGVQRNDFSFEEVDDLIENADTNITFEFGLRKRVDRTQVNFDLEHAIYPSGSGFISEINSARFWMERKFSQRLTGSVGARYERTKTVDEVSTVNERTYVRLDLDIKWALTERWSLTAGYQLTDQEFRDIPDSQSQSNAIYLGISFEGLPTQY